jgi:hypothetical protein
METPMVGASFGIHRIRKNAVLIIIRNPLFFKKLHRSLVSPQGGLAP